MRDVQQSTFLWVGLASVLDSFRYVLARMMNRVNSPQDTFRIEPSDGAHSPWHINWTAVAGKTADIENTSEERHHDECWIHRGLEPAAAISDSWLLHWRMDHLLRAFGVLDPTRHDNRNSA